MLNVLNSKSPIFSQKLEELIFKSSGDLNRHILDKFLTAEHLPQLTEALLDDGYWNIFRVATASLFLENKSEELLQHFLETIGGFIYQNDEKREKIEEVLLEGFVYALPEQIEHTINILNRINEKFSINDAFIPSLFCEKLKNNLSTV